MFKQVTKLEISRNFKNEYVWKIEILLKKKTSDMMYNGNINETENCMSLDTQNKVYCIHAMHALRDNFKISLIV